MLSVPVGGQFEQILNALYLQKLNYGRHAVALDGRALGAFLEALPDCEKALAGYSQDGNRVLLEALDAKLNEALAKKGTWDETTV
jgi:hypothetical protein